MATPQQRVVEWALAQVGYVANPDKTNKYAAFMDTTGFYNGPKNGFDWCDVFADCAYVKCFGVDTALKMTNQRKGGGGAGCWISAACYRDAGWWSSQPQLGAQVFFGTLGDEGHTGIVTRVGGSTFDATEGNTGYSQGYSGGAVLTHTYDIGASRVVGFGIPNWSLVESKAEWVQASDGRWWYRHADGSYTKDGWEKIDGEWYYFDKEGWMLESTVIEDRGSFYALGPSGAMLTDIATHKEHDGRFGAIEL